MRVKTTKKSTPDEYDVICNHVYIPIQIIASWQCAITSGNGRSISPKPVIKSCHEQGIFCRSDNKNQPKSLALASFLTFGTLGALEVFQLEDYLDFFLLWYEFLMCS